MTGRDVLRRAIGGHKGRLTAASVLAAAHQGCEALVPVLIGVVVDQAIAPGSAAELVTWLIVLVVLFAALSNTYRHALRLAERAAEYTGHRIRLELSERILHPRGGAEAGHLPGALVNIATEDARRVGSVNGVLPFGIAAATGIVVSAVFLLLVSVPLGLLVLLGIPPLLWLGHAIGKPLERRSGVEQERAAHASGIAADLVAGLRVLKGIGAEPAAIDRYRRTSQDSLGATLRAARAQAWHSGAVLTLTGIFIALVALVGGNLAISGSISIGDLVAAVGLAQYLLAPLSVLGWANAELAQGRASAARVAEVLSAPQTVEGGTGTVPAEVAGEIRLSGVRHGALKGVDLEVAPGELVGVVTGDPAAATSLLDCLGRDVDPVEGTVLLDGTPLSSMDPHEVRAAILVAAHDADLFEGSLLENVGSEEVLSAAAADEVASALPDGVHTAITERGHSLSGGQRQRVALARALAVEAPVLVVHDPTTAVDTVTEARIAAGLARFRRARTTVLVTTSPALLAETDRVTLIEDGAVSAVGRHVDLVRDLPAYRAAVLS